MKKWIDQIGNLGKAMIEIELVGQGYPVLFVAIIASKRYLVETLDYEEGIYLLSSTTESRLLDMLNGINDIYTSVSGGKKKYYVSYNYEVGEYEAEEIDSGKLSDDDMPDKGVFFKINTSTISEYKQFLAKSISAKSIKKNKAEVLSQQVSIEVENWKNTISIAAARKGALKRKRRVASMQFNNTKRADNVCIG